SGWARRGGGPGAPPTPWGRAAGRGRGGAAHASAAPPLGPARAPALFVARAGAKDPAFAPPAADTAAIAEICRRVDGLPLAIELAAGRATLVPPPKLAALVAGGLDALTTTMRDAPERQRTLRAPLAWSHRCPAPEEAAG